MVMIDPSNIPPPSYTEQIKCPTHPYLSFHRHPSSLPNLLIPIPI